MEEQINIPNDAFKVVLQQRQDSKNFDVLYSKKNCKALYIIKKNLTYENAINLMCNYYDKKGKNDK